MSFTFIEQEQERYGPPTPVPIKQEEAEFSRLLDLYRERKPKRVLELGSWMGGTLFHWLQNALGGTTVVAVDEKHPNASLYDSWCAPSVSCVSLTGNSRDLRVRDAAVTGSPYDFIFIDAGHLFGEAWADWILYGSLHANPSVVAFHDIVRHDDYPNIQVWALWEDLKLEHETEEFVSDGGSGIGVVHMP